MTEPMSDGRKRGRKFRTQLCGFFLAIAVTLSWGQSTEQKPSSSPQAAPPAGRQKPGSSKHQQKGTEAAQSAPSNPSETKIASQEAEELFRSVDEILKFSSQETGLPIK